MLREHDQDQDEPRNGSVSPGQSPAFWAGLRRWWGLLAVGPSRQRRSTCGVPAPHGTRSWSSASSASTQMECCPPRGACFTRTPCSGRTLLTKNFSERVFWPLLCKGYLPCTWYRIKLSTGLGRARIDWFRVSCRSDRATLLGCLLGSVRVGSIPNLTETVALYGFW